MLVLLSFALVLVATVLLVLGLLNDDGMTLIYLSIASSVAAAIVLLVALKVNKPRHEVQRAAPEPLEDRLAPQPALATAGATSAPTAQAAPDDGEWLASDQDTYAAAVDGGPADAGDDLWREGDDLEEVEFPIAEYDTLTAGQILPLLPQLYADEIPVVEERERLTKARPEILDRLAELRTGFAPSVPPTEPAAEPRAVDPLADHTDPVPGAGWDDDDDWFPIEDYEALSAAQIRPLLPELDAEELRLVRDKEAALGRRRSLLDEIDRLLGASAGGGPASASPPSTETAPAGASLQPDATETAERAAAKAASGKRASARKAAGTTRSAAKATSKATAKKATRKAPAAKKATSARSAAKKTPAKATTRKVAKKATPAKATAKKKAATKKATPRKAPTKRSDQG